MSQTCVSAHVFFIAWRAVLLLFYHIHPCSGFVVPTSKLSCVFSVPSWWRPAGGLLPFDDPLPALPDHRPGRADPTGPPAPAPRRVSGD